jgi:hypothetical protein
MRLISAPGAGFALRSPVRKILLGLAVAAIAVSASFAHADPLAHLGTRSYRSLRDDLKRSMSNDAWRALKATPVGLVSMRSRWNGEDREGFVKDGTPRRAVRYLRTAAEREKFRITLGADGKLYTAGGKPFHTDGHLVTMMVATDGAMYAETDREVVHRDNIKHSSYLAGADAPMALEIEVEHGRPVLATNRSGHYRPERIAFVRWLLSVEDRMDTSRLDIRFDEKSQ